ncbi:MAG: ATP-dependent Clp protease adapter ClpS [Lentisphaerae bacterium]|nr:ATP-dependent Clp protease adapter ClpS [Lentisphaerota bacterium]MCP4103589.1 ATP-dependent Clp protease adapter ClpS [Lentisphaerota bacterium]
MHQTKESVIEAQKLDVQEPSRYKVVLLNDDYTTMDFVIMVLMVIFHRTLDEAQNIMISVHKSGKAVCGIYAFEVAETKVAQVKSLAGQHKFPLRCAMEKE